MIIKSLAQLEGAIMMAALEYKIHSEREFCFEVEIQKYGYKVTFWFNTGYKKEGAPDFQITPVQSRLWFTVDLNSHIKKVQAILDDNFQMIPEGKPENQYGITV
jgi:hypothetical protein